MADPSPRSLNGVRQPFAANELQFEEVHVLDYLKVLHKRRWTASSAFLIVVIAVTVHTFTVTPKFRATARLLIGPDNANVVEFQPVVDELQAEANYYQTQYELLRSRTLARRTLRDHDVIEGLRPQRDSEPAPSGLLGTVRSWLSAMTAFMRPADSGPVSDGEEGPEDARATSRLLGMIEVSPVRNSRLVDLTVESPDQRLAADVANAHARAYVDQNLELRLLASQEASGWLREQLEEQRRKVEESEWALQRYLEENGTVTFEDGQNIVIERLVDLNTALTEARTARIGIETRYNRLRAVRNDAEAIYSFPAIINNQYIQEQRLELSRLEREYVELSENLGERHPEILGVRSAIESVTARIDDEIQSVADSIEDEFLAARTEENTLAAELERQKLEALGSNQKEIQYTVLSREVGSNREVYDALLQRVKETDVSGELQTNNIRIVDSAEVPESPASPRKAFNLLLALLGGSVLGIGLAFFFEYADTRIKTAEEVRAHLGLSTLGLVPVISSKLMQQIGTPLVNNGVPPGFRESLGSLRTNLLFAASSEAEENEENDDAGVRPLLVTSTGPREGKTLLSTNLSMSFAQAGQRVLLIDADLRLPRVHQIFEQASEPGLTNLLTGDSKAEEAIRQTSVSGLWVLPAGTIPPNPAELLSSKRFKALFKALRTHFDRIVIDSPPVLPVPDSSVLAPLGCSVLFVIGAEMTSRDAAQTALERLDAVRAYFAGAVLNRVPVERNRYYYSRYYRSEYASYYTRPSAADINRT